MKRVRSLLRRVAANPDRVPAYIGLNVKKSVRLLRDGRVSELIGYLTELLTGRNPYLDSVRSGSSSRFVERTIRGQSMFVDATDPGISRTLLAYGAHEQHSTDVFVDALSDLAADVDGRVTVLEIGANVGYFCLIEAGVIGTRGRIHAFEPHPGNADLLETNVTHNGYDGVVDIHRAAVGAETKPVALQLHDNANHYTVWTSPEGTTDESPAAASKEYVSLPDIGSVSVEQVSIESVLADGSIPPESVHVVRLDVDGYEAEVFRGLNSVLETTSPLLIHVELHPQRLDEPELDGILSSLEENGFEILSATANGSTVGIPAAANWYGNPLDIGSFEELRRVLTENGWWVELIARR